MGIGRDLATVVARQTDESEQYRRLVEVATAAVEGYESEQISVGQFNRRMESLKAVLQIQDPKTSPPIVWDVDPKKHFGRQGGRIVATITEQPDSTWVLTTDDNRQWPAFRSADAARRAFEDSRQTKGENRASAVSHWWRDTAYRSDLIVNGSLLGSVVWNDADDCWSLFHNGEYAGFVRNLDRKDDAKRQVVSFIGLPTVDSRTQAVEGQSVGA